MEYQEVTVIEIKKKYKKLVQEYLTRKQLKYHLLEPDNNGKSRIEIRNLNSREAFDLGVLAQAQLLDGEFLI